MLNKNYLYYVQPGEREDAGPTVLLHMKKKHKWGSRTNMESSACKDLDEWIYQQRIIKNRTNTKRIVSYPLSNPRKLVIQEYATSWDIHSTDLCCKSKSVKGFRREDTVLEKRTVIMWPTTGKRTRPWRQHLKILTSMYNSQNLLFPSYEQKENCFTCFILTYKLN